MSVYEPKPDEGLDPAWAWAPYRPGPGRPWSLVQAGHLLRRVAQGGSWAALQRILRDGPERSVARWLEPGPEAATFAAAADADERAAVKDLPTLGAWWLRRLIDSPDPLRESLTLCWHNHFAIPGRELADAQALVRHVQALRRNADGSPAALVGTVVDDPAVYEALGATQHRRRRPEERLVRPLLEVFTLGPGACSPDDIAAAARAWSGWFVIRGRLRFLPREQDLSAKTFRGRTGPWQRADIVTQLLGERATARTLVRALVRWFVTETEELPPSLLDPLVRALARDAAIRPVVATVLRSNLFYSTRAFRRRVQSPVAYAVGLLRALEARVSTTALARHVAGLGQTLGDPPTVHGWAGGLHWLNTTTLIRRRRLAEALVAREGPLGGRVDLTGRASTGAGAVSLRQLLLQETRADDAPAAAGAFLDVVTEPLYQLA